MINRIQFVLSFITFFIGLASFSQNHVNPRAIESDKLSLSVVQHHLNDSFYLQMRPLPGVRFETRDYVIRYNGKKWTSNFSNKCLRKDGCVIKSQKIKTKQTAAFNIAQKINFKRMLELPVSDSMKVENPKIAGAPSYFIIVCSKGKVRKIEYPFNFHYDTPNESIFWQSDYLESVIRELEKLAENAKVKHR